MVSSCLLQILIIAFLVTSNCDSLGISQNNQAIDTEVLDGAKCYCCSKNCQFVIKNSTLICTGVRRFHAEYLRQCSESIVHLEIVKSGAKNITDLGLDDSVTLPNLESISLRNCLIRRVEHLPNEKLLRRIELSRNPVLEDVKQQIFANTAKLTYLDLSHNQLKSIDRTDILTNLTTLNLSGNDWSCNVDFSWLVDMHYNRTLVNGDHLLCHDANRKNNSWIKWSYSVLKREETKQVVQAECQQRTAGCSCQFTSEGKEGRGSYKVQVDCSRKNLTTLPDQLPNNTNELDVSGNELTSLDKVNRYDSQPLRILIADSNKITSIMDLSRSVFMRNFSRLSLQHNQIKPYDIPFEELTQVSSQFQVKYVYLYNNSWDCDCKMAKEFREWLLKHRITVNDSSILMCSRDNKKIPVLHLLPETICQTGEFDGQVGDKEQTIRILQGLICLEVILIAIVAIKLAYDSWRYLCHGELPWIASKLF